MALSYGVSFFTGEEIKPHVCSEECEGEAEGVTLYLPCLACHGRGCAACGPGGHVALYTCPFRRDLGDAWEYVSLHQHYPGTLPLAGGLYNQPAPYVVAMRLLDRAKTLLTEAAVRKAEKNGGN